MRSWIIFLLLAGLALPTTANQRIALVIGNNAYPDAPLFNPVNDADAVADALAGLGFEIVKATDADLAAMQAALLEFSGRIEEGATALVFYAGHGIQANGRNYLVPIDATLESEGRLRFEALEMADVLEELEYSDAKLNLVVLDACRNNPFLGRARGASGGLAAVDAAAGTLIAYATGPGATASDGRGSNGLYTQHFIDTLKTPNLKAEEVFKQVRIGVARDSGGDQIPWESSSLTGDFVFNQRVDAATPAVLADSSAAAAGNRMDNGAAEALFWETVREDDRASSYAAYLNRFPSGLFAPLATDRLAVLAAQDANDARCTDLSGIWVDWRGDRDCASRSIFAVDPSAPGRYRVTSEVCAAEGMAGLLSGLGPASASASAHLEGQTLTLDWQHGPCSGVTEIELDAQCSAGSGLIIGQRGGFGVCAGIRETIRTERATEQG